MSEENLAKEIAEETPWWAKAPIWLAAGIVGVPSMIAIGAGYFIVQTIQGALIKHMTDTRAEIVEQQIMIDTINKNQAELLENWRYLRDYMAARLAVEQRTCLHQAKDDQQRDDCLEVPHSNVIGPPK